jgi:hypothetical protein
MKRFKITIFMIAMILHTNILFSTYLMPVINEVMYNPTASIVGNRWIELYNPSNYPVYLEGWQLQIAGSSFQTVLNFPFIELPAEGYLVVGEPNVAFADLYCELPLPTGTSATGGARLVSGDGMYTDTILYGSPNTYNLPDDTSQNATSFVRIAPTGYSLARKPNGVDTNHPSDWEICLYPSPHLPNFLYIDLNISELYMTKTGFIHTLNVVIRNLSTIDVDISQLKIYVIHDGITIYDAYPNIPFDNDLAHFCLPVYPTEDAINNFFAMISYPQNVNKVDFSKTLKYWQGLVPVIINEVQYRPTAPEPEWIEFFNRSHEPFTLVDAFIQTNAGRRAYFSTTIPAGDYLVITQNMETFLNKHPTTDISKIIQPSSWAILTNVSDSATLFLDEELILDSMEYTSVGSQAGKSLERVNPFSDENITWKYSKAIGGSTPQLRNSQTPSDVSALIGSVEIEKTANGYTHDIYLKNDGLVENISVSLFISSRYEGFEHFDLLDIINLSLYDSDVYQYISPFPCQTGYQYFRYVLEFEGDYSEFQRAVLNGSPPVVVNEIMSNPLSNEPKWIELIRLKDTFPEKGIKFFANNDSLHIAPFDSEYALITLTASDVLFLRENYQIPENIPIIRGLRSLNISGEKLTIADYDENIYESFEYTSDFSPLRGISAERISPYLSPTPQNWVPSLSNSTPAQRNSVFMSLIPTETFISIQNNPFSPYRSEFCIIHINVPEHTIRADVKIFDIKGRPVINLGDKTTVPGEYSFIWHGLDSSGRTVSPGIYPVSIIVDDMSGKNITSSKKVIYVGK